VSTRLALALASVIALLLSACRGESSSSPSTELPAAAVSDVHALAPTVTPEGTHTAELALALHNAGTTRDRLLEVSCTCAAGAEIHGGSDAGDTGPVDSIPLPADKAVFFGPGGPHIVLLGITEPLQVGEAVTVSFTFETATPSTADAIVVAAKTPSPAA
jgi:copper(I)-binding protein